MEEQFCLDCGKPFTKRKGTRFCGKICQQRYWGDTHYEEHCKIKNRYYAKHRLKIMNKAKLIRKTIEDRWSKLKNSHWARGGNPNDFNLTSDELKMIISKYKTCPYCNVNHSDSLDHILPFKIHPKTNKNNIAFCCHSCNASKAEHPLQEWFSINRCKSLGIDINTINPKVITQLEAIR